MKLNKLEFLLMNNPIRNLIQNHIEVKRLRKWSNLPPNKTYKLVIDYPMEYPAEYDIHTGKNGLSLVELLGKIGKLYQKTYDKEDQLHLHEIYGHDIGDLSLSEVAVDHKKKIITLCVDS